MLELKEISKNYGNKQVLRQVNLTMKDGIYGLLGINGAGKTTLIHIIANLLNTYSGEVFYNDKDIRKQEREYRDVMGYMPQYPTFYPNFTAEEFLKYICVIKGIPADKHRNQVLESLESVNLLENRKNKIKTFSGGMRQRLGIAQAMINNPDILILDEPTAGLDPIERIRFRNIISTLSTNRIIILATHIVQDIEYIANQVIILHHGRIVVQEKSDKLINQIRGKVKTIYPFNGSLEQIDKEQIVCNVFYENGQCGIRLIAEQELPYAFKIQEPNLEDVFLYYTKGQ